MVDKKAQKIIKGSISSLATVSILNIGSIYPNNILENEESNDKNTAVIEDKIITSKKNDKINIESENQFNLTNGQVINKTYQVIAAGNNLVIDGKDVSNNSVKSINGNAKLVFETTQTDVFFKNTVAIGNEIIGIFNEGTYSKWHTYTYDINAKYFDSDKKTLTIAFHAGNKANALEHDIENNDDFLLKNIHMILPDGTILKVAKYQGIYSSEIDKQSEDKWSVNILDDITSKSEIEMGDGKNRIEILYVTFKLENHNFNALRYDLDTTLLTDGKHLITSGNNSVEIISDNTAPVIETNMIDGQIYHNGTIEARAYDAISKECQLVATLDGKAIELPYSFRSLQIEPGEHVLSLSADDAVGNVQTKIIKFVTFTEQASINEDIKPINGTTIEGDPTFYLTATDPTNDLMNVFFKRGERYIKGDSNIVEDSGISQIAGSNDKSFKNDSKNGFPFCQFDLKINDNINEDAMVKIEWKGNSNNQKTYIYVYNYKSNNWDKLNASMTFKDGMSEIVGEVSLKEHLLDNVLKIMIQNGEGYTPDQYDYNNQTNTLNIDDTPRSNYDFTFAIESDTQYYNKNINDNYKHQLNIHKWLVANRERMNIQYLFHDGDIIDDKDQEIQWINANNAYKILDDANFPYGILAGNHDVGHLSNDYTNFYKYFGKLRYDQNPWYGESYKNNKGHYDLITVGGIDFIMLYMGWGIDNDEIEWLNDVLAKYPERKAILNLHEYLLASGGLGDKSQQIYDEVIAKNSNVCMVLSGHYHSAQTIVSEFDDNNDGINDRKVYQMLFDYQRLTQGGMGYIRLMHFDNKNGKIFVRTYSPSLDDYNAKDEKDIGNEASIIGEEEFIINYKDLGIKPTKKQIETTDLEVNVYSNNIIGSISDVKSNDKIQYTWQYAPHGIVGWYAEITDENGGLTRSKVNYVNIDKENIKPMIVIDNKESNLVSLGNSFDPLKNIRAYDSQGKDLTDQILVLGSVDVNNVGRYELIYKVSDSFGNVTIVPRIIEVVDKNNKVNVDLNYFFNKLIYKDE